MITSLIVIVVVSIGAAFALWYFIKEYRRPNRGDSNTGTSSTIKKTVKSVAAKAVDAPLFDAKGLTLEGDSLCEVDSEPDFDMVYERAGNSYLTLETAGEERIGNVLEFLGKMPPLPVATIDLLPMLSSQNTSARDIANVISADPSLVAKILRRINSPYYGLDVKINSIQQAISLFGFTNIRAISLREYFDSLLNPERVGDLDPDDIWRHMAATGLISKHLGKKVKGVNPDFAGTAGLLHDIGLLIMLAVKKDTLADAVNLMVAEQKPLCECEEALYGVNHQVLGAALGKKWNLSDELCSTVGRHHTPYSENGLEKVPAIIWLAHIAASKLGFSHRPMAYVKQDCMEVADALGLEWPITNNITEGLLRELIRMLSMWKEADQTAPVQSTEEKKEPASKA